MKNNNIDVLISKYLDGSLKRDEDLLLRRLIKENPEDKEKFDTAIQVYVGVKEDASEIQVPNELYHKTEELILAKILSQQPIIIEAQRIGLGKRRKKLFYVLAPAIVVFLILVSAIEIGDKFREYEFSSVYGSSVASLQGQLSIGNVDYPVLESIKNKNEVQVRDRLAKRVVNKKVTSIRSNGDVSVVEGDNADIVPLSVDKDSDEDWAVGNLENDELINTFDNGIVSFQPYQLNAFPEPVPRTDYNLDVVGKKFRQNFYAKDYYYTGRDIWVSSFLGMDVFKDIGGSSANSLISHFSQSIAYSLGKEHKVGLEVGWMDYSYNKEDQVVTNDGKAKSGGTKVEVVDPQPTGSRYYSRTIAYDSHKQIYWTSVFYEYNVLNLDRIALNSRIALGLSDEGFLTYSKLFAQVNILTNVGLTLGVEGRMFQAKLPNVNNDMLLMHKTLSVIYGVHFKF